MEQDKPEVVAALVFLLGGGVGVVLCALVVMAVLR